MATDTTDRMAKARAARDANIAARATEKAEAKNAEAKSQCLFCGLFFQEVLLLPHQQAVHAALLKEAESRKAPQLTAEQRKLSPGSIVRTDGPEGVPVKVPWSREWLERGWECDDSRCKDPAKPGWRVIPEAGRTPVCGVCGGPMHPMFGMVDWDAPGDCAESVMLNGVRYDLVPGATNRVPSIIRDIARQSITATRQGDRQIPAGVRRLATAGLLPPLEEE